MNQIRTTRRSADSLPDSEHIIGVYTGGFTGAADQLQINVVVNWFDEVRQRVQWFERLDTSLVLIH